MAVHKIERGANTIHRPPEGEFILPNCLVNVDKFLKRIYNSLTVGVFSRQRPISSGKGAAFMKQTYVAKDPASREAYPMDEGVTQSYRYTGSPSFFCKIDAVPKPPYMRHPKGWTSEQQRKLDQRR